MRRKTNHRILASLMAAAMVFSSCNGVPGFTNSTVYASDLESQESAVVASILENANLDFENGTDGWVITGNASVIANGAKSGEKYLHLDPGASAKLLLTDISQGSYTLSAWVKGTQNGKNDAKLSISETGGPKAESLLNTYLSGDWAQMGNRNVLVYNGQMEITITAGSCAVDIDDIEIACDSEDSNTISNWDFEAGLENWNVSGAVDIDKSNADTGEAALKLADQSEISQVVSVKPNTRYSVTMRAKVDTQDEFKTIYHSNYRGKTGETQERTLLGDRVNLGVRGVSGDVVYRQAPSGTEGYSLVSITFETGNENEVEIYANTVFDENYKNSVTVYNTEGTELADEWTGNGDDYAYVDNFDLFVVDDDNYLRGADISFLPAIEDLGGKYFANGVQQDCLRILSNHGVNSVLTMIMVHAGKVTHHTSTGKPLDQISGQNWELYKEDGSVYEYQMIQGGYFDKEHCVEIGKRATELGMSYLPSFHFSDTWISNAKAYTPEEWLNVDYEGNYTNSDIAHVQTAVYNYVYDFMSDLKANDVNVAAIKNGNEQNGGLIWPVGKGATTTGHAAIVSAAYEAEEDVFGGVSNWVHTNNGYDTGAADSFFNGLKNNGAKFEGTAFSLYGGRPTHCIIEMGEKLQTLDALKYMDFVEVETGFTFTGYYPTVDTAAGTMVQAAYYQATPNGQYNWLLDYMQALIDVSNPYGQTRGFYYWETDWIPTPGAGSSDGSSADVNRRIMFNNGDPSIHEMGSTMDGRAGDMMDSMYAYLMRGCAKEKAKEMQTPVSQGSSAYAVEVKEPTAITLADTRIELVEGKYQRLKPTIAPANVVVTDSSVEYTTSDPEVAVVNGNGLVVGKKAGTATITATVGNCSTTAVVNVKSAKVSDGISVTVNGKAAADTKASLFDRIELNASLSGNPTNDAVVYRSSDPDVASFYGETWQTKAGQMYQETAKDTKVQLNCKEAGTTTITVEAVDGGAKYSFDVTVEKTAVESVKINQGNELSISYSRTAQLTATVLPKNTSRYHVNWISENEDVATVDENGLVTGVGIGDAVIKAVSDDNEEIFGECLVHVLQVQVEGITLDRDTLTLQTGTSKTINTLITPEDAYNKNVSWRSEDEDIATVDENGKVTAVKAGSTTIVATTENGGYTAECIVKVQDEAVAVTGVEISDKEYYFSSDYFSENNENEEVPVYRMSTTVEPIDATNDSVIWSSDTPSVATIDDFGRITPVGAGVTTISATTEDGGYVATAKVYVPSISESFDNREAGDTWSTKVSSTGGGALGAAVVESEEGKYLEISGGGSGGRSIQKRFAQTVKNGKMVVDFDWMPGTLSGSNGAFVSITDSSNNRYLTIQQASTNTDLVYAAGGAMAADILSESSKVGQGFNVSSNWYHVHAVIDTEKQATVFTITSLNDSSVKATHTVAFADGVSYAGDVAALQMYATRVKGGSLSWKTRFDNVNVYAAEPVAKSITVNKKKVKIIPVKGTLMAACQLSAAIEPASADQKVIWSTSDTSVATIDENGSVKPVVLYDKIDDVKTANCVITVRSEKNPDISAEIPVEISNSPNAFEFFSIQDEKGNFVYGGDGAVTIQMQTREEKQLSTLITGGDGDTDIAGIKWTSDNEKVLGIDEATGVMKAKKAGLAHVTVKVDFYVGESQSAIIPVEVSGESFAETDDLEKAIEQAKKAKSENDDWYNEDSLAKYNDALENANSVLKNATEENWSSAKQNLIDEATEALNRAVEGLKKADVIAIKGIKVEAVGYPVSIGKSITLSATSTPAYATEAINWSSSDSSVAIVNKKTGEVHALKAGNATIFATSESGQVKAETKITVTSDLSSYFDKNGVTVTATNTSPKYTAENPFIAARTMKFDGTVWSTGSATKVGVITADLGQAAKIDNLTTVFWSQMNYTIDVSDNGTDWVTVVDHSVEPAGVLCTSSTPWVDEMPENTEARYVRLNVLKNAGTGWVGVTIMQVNGEFISDIDMVDSVEQANMTLTAGDEITADKLPETVKVTLIDGSEVDSQVIWDAEALKAVDKAGEYVIPGKVTVNGKEYESELILTIEKIDISKANVELDKESYTYTGSDIIPEISVKVGDKVIDPSNYLVTLENNKNAGKADIKITGVGDCYGEITKSFEIKKANVESAEVELEYGEIVYDGTTKEPIVIVAIDGYKLIKGTDYMVSYDNNINAGTAVVTINGLGNFEGKVSRTFVIKAKSIDNAIVTLGKDSFDYDGAAKEPAVVVTLDGIALNSETDYAVSYSNNTKPGTATVTVKGKGNYSGTVNKCFEIVDPIPMNSLERAEITLEKDSYPYNGFSKKPAVKVVLNGVELKSGKDYKASYKDNKEIGTAKVTLTGKGKYTGVVTKEYQIVPGTTHINGIKNEKSGIEINWNWILGVDGYYVYSKAGAGKWKKIATVKGQLSLSYTDESQIVTGTKYQYKVVAYKGQAESEYSNVVSIIGMATPTIKSVTNKAGKSLDVTWDTLAGADGYEVQYALTGAFLIPGSQTVSASSANISKLMKGIKYYVRVRSYKTVDGKKYYSDWSDAVSGKVTK